MQLLWQAGKLSSYLFLGAVAGYTGIFFNFFFTDPARLQSLLSYLTGGIILLMGLSLLGLIPMRGRQETGFGTNLLTEICKRFCTGASPGAALALGVVSGFLPCPIVIAFLAYSLQSGSVVAGMSTMGALGLGTMLPLLLLGGATRLTAIHFNWGARAGGVILILLGLLTTLRGTDAFHHQRGCRPEQSPPFSRTKGISPRYYPAYHP